MNKLEMKIIFNIKTSSGMKGRRTPNRNKLSRYVRHTGFARSIILKAEPRIVYGKIKLIDACNIGYQHKIFTLYSKY